MILFLPSYVIGMIQRGKDEMSFFVSRGLELLTVCQGITFMCEERFILKDDLQSYNSSTSPRYRDSVILESTVTIQPTNCILASLIG